MPPKTPINAKIIVKTGVFNPNNLSSLIPHQVAIRIMAII